LRDQASKLRAMSRGSFFKMGRERTSLRTIAVTSGKGGVGKTSLVVNLALALAKLGQRAVVFDADLGLANVDVLLGLNPPYNLYDVLYGEKNIRDIIVTGPLGVKIVSGGSGIQELANLDTSGRQRLITALSYLNEQADFILIDTSGGISRNVLGFVAAAGEVVIVATPEPTSLTDAYSMIKVLATNRVHSEVNLVVNMAADEREARITATKIISVTKRFLQIKVKYTGSICMDPVVGKAVKMQQPFVLLAPHSVASAGLSAIAGALLGERVEPGRGMGSFLGKLLRLFG